MLSIFSKGECDMKRRITFIFDNYSSGEPRKLYKVDKILIQNSSIRKVCLSVINDAIKHGLITWTNFVDDSNSVAVYVSSDAITDAHTGWVKSGFGIKYAINRDGSIKVLNGYDPLHQDWTLSEIDELINCKYIEGDSSKLIIALPNGIGASPQDLFDWLGFASNIFQMTGAVGYIFLKLRLLIVDRKIRRIVDRWIKNGMRYPVQIRDFIDVKGEWKLGEVKKRLKLSDEYSIKLLDALGLEPKGDLWRLTHSDRSINNRKRWIRNEKRYIKSMEISE